MRVLLLHRDRDLDLAAPEPPHAEDLVQDLELETLVAAMAGGSEGGDCSWPTCPDGCYWRG